MPSDIEPRRDAAIARRLDCSADVAHELGQRIEAGINHNGLALPEVPFGGVKDSGHGTEGGSEAIEAYLVTNWVTQMPA